MPRKKRILKLQAPRKTSIQTAVYKKAAPYPACFSSSESESYLNLAILANSNIKVIKIGDAEVKIMLYTDDTTLFLRDPNFVHSLLEILELFKNC